MIRGYNICQKTVREMNLKPFVFSFENLKALTSMCTGIVYTTYWYDNGINQRFTWIDEMSEYTFFATRNEAYIHNCMSIQKLFNELKKHRQEKRFYIGLYRNTMTCYIYARDILRRDFYIIFYGENDMMPPIYVVSLHEKFKKDFGFFGLELTVGFFYNKKEAIESLNVRYITSRKQFKYASIAKCYQGYSLLITELDIYRYREEKHKFYSIQTPKTLISDETIRL